jgi:nitrate/nitrite transporter NarK
LLGGGLFFTICILVFLRHLGGWLSDRLDGLRGGFLLDRLNNFMLGWGSLWGDTILLNGRGLCRLLHLLVWSLLCHR